MESAQFFAKIFGLTFTGAMGRFVPVRVNENLTLDFDNKDSFGGHHYVFHVSEEELDTIFERIKSSRIAYGSEPASQENM